MMTPVDARIPPDQAAEHAAAWLVHIGVYSPIDQDVAKAAFLESWENDQAARFEEIELEAGDLEQQAQSYLDEAADYEAPGNDPEDRAEGRRCSKHAAKLLAKANSLRAQHIEQSRDCRTYLIKWANSHARALSKR